jgi:hypothetical protein
MHQGAAAVARDQEQSLTGRPGDAMDMKLVSYLVLHELPDPPFEEVLLRRTSRPDGMGKSGQMRTTGFGLADGRVAWFQLVYHPLHDLEHPFRRNGLVTRLWPDPPARLNVRGHPILDHRTRLAQLFVDGGFCHGLRLGERSSGNGPTMGRMVIGFVFLAQAPQVHPGDTPTLRLFGKPRAPRRGQQLSHRVGTRPARNEHAPTSAS